MRDGRTGSEKSFEAALCSASGVSPTKSEWLIAAEAAQYLKVKPRSLLLWGAPRQSPGICPQWHKATRVAVSETRNLGGDVRSGDRLNLV